MTFLATYLNTASGSEREQVADAFRQLMPGSGDYTTVAQFMADSIPTTVTAFTVDGYTTAGDGGAGLWVRAAVQSAGNGKRQSADGAYWELSEALTNAKMLGAASAGDASTATQEALNAGAGTVILPAGESFQLGGVTLTNSQAIDATSAALSAKAASTNAVKLTNYSARLLGAYFASGTSASQSVVKVEESRFALIRDVTAVNCGPGFINLTPTNPATVYISLPIISNCDAEDISGTGVNIGSSVSELRASNVHLHGLLVNTAGLFKPTASSIGWKQNTPLSTFATGGHQIVNANMICFEKGYHLTDALLTKFSNSISDSCSDYGLLVDGVSDFIEIADHFNGTTRGAKFAGSSRGYVNGLNSALNGVIPSWATANFYNGVGTFYDIEVRGTAKWIMRGLVGDRRIAVDSTAKLIVDDGMVFHGRSAGNVAAGTTVYLTEAGQTATRLNAQWRAPYDCFLIRLTAWSTQAPGVGKNFTYAASVNAVSVLSTQISGAAAFTNEVWAGSHISVDKGQVIDLSVVTDAASAVDQHWADVQIVPRN